MAGADGLLRLLRRLNRHVAHAAGAAWLGCAGLVVADTVLRRMGAGFGGTDEVAGYVMAIATAWSLAYALTERAHVRIDLIRGRLGDAGRAALDLLALAALSGVALAVAWRCWPVLERSLANGSRANTPLETPLWWVQAPWMAGWAWFAATCVALTAIALRELLRGRAGSVEAAAGLAPEPAPASPEAAR
jgi:TRAP-type C4-dicarboxylate transport system permease small subunit